MAGDELTSISGLQETHRRALADKLKITSLRALADADQRAIYAALANIRPRPSLARIAAWQADAREQSSDAVSDTSEWHTAASFAVIFAQRQVDGVWEHRLEAEQTEVEPASESRLWEGWDCAPLCGWMLGHLRPTEQQPEDTADVAPAAGAVSARGDWTELHIDTATIIDARRERELISAGNVVAAPPEDLSPPVLLRVTVSGGRTSQELRAAVWFRRRAEPGWSPHDPVIVSRTGQAEFDLSSVPSGDHDIRLLAWATDPGATLAAATLPPLTLREEA